jgi:hypothetical protein
MISGAGGSAEYLVERTAAQSIWQLNSTMDVHKSSLLSIFDAKQCLEVPLFQRQYVWHEEQQWLPLWEDIERKFTETLEGRKNALNDDGFGFFFQRNWSPQTGNARRPGGQDYR